MKTLAIVLGNDKYYNGAALNNAVNDALAVSKVFENLGYDVIYKSDSKMDEYVALLDEFDRRIKEYDATIFYFAGHGFQLDGENYLASIDCQVNNPNKYHCSRSCIMLSEILSILKNNSDKINIVIIDACRKNFERGASSFSPIQSPKGTLIAFSTSPNEGASDAGFDNHSIYTGALLKYIGREWLSVEDLFKKVRKTVYNLSEGRQTTWEHTSLIGDFHFNTGQLVYSKDIPYDESVIKDRNFVSEGTDIDRIIVDLKSSNWNKQNPAIYNLSKIDSEEINKNQQFIIGRNLLQASGYAHSATDFVDDIESNLSKYSKSDGNNHVLNGMLFEIYFDSYGEFRKGNFKLSYFEKIIALRKNKKFDSSFKFIQGALQPFREHLYYIPSHENNIVDIDVLATSEIVKDLSNRENTYEVISKINISTDDITHQLYSYGLYGGNIHTLKLALATFLVTPIELIHINPNIPINKIDFASNFKDQESEFDW